MLDHLGQQQVWNGIHQGKPSSEYPEEEVVAFAQRLQRQLPPKSSVLDAGCGRGRNAFYLSRLGFTVCGCDLSPLALGMASKQPGNAAKFQISHLTQLPYADNTFAAVICVHVLPYHLKADIIKSISELWRVLQPSGWLYYDLLDCNDLEYGHGQRLEEHTFLTLDGTPIHFSSRQEVNELAKGFSLERVARLELKSPSSYFRVAWAIWALKCDEQYHTD